MQPPAQGQVGEGEDGQTPRALPHVAEGEEASVPGAPLMAEKDEADQVQSAPSHDMGVVGGGRERRPLSWRPKDLENHNGEKNKKREKEEHGKRNSRAPRPAKKGQYNSVIKTARGSEYRRGSHVRENKHSRVTLAHGCNSRSTTHHPRCRSRLCDQVKQHGDVAPASTHV